MAEGRGGREGEKGPGRCSAKTSNIGTWRHRGGNNKGGHMIATNQDQTNLTVICRHLAIKVTQTLDINVPGISASRLAQLPATLILPPLLIATSSDPTSDGKSFTNITGHRPYSKSCIIQCIFCFDTRVN